MEFAIECDAADPESVREMFETAQRAALFPGSKLHALDSDKIEMAPELVSSLKYVFDRADVDGDGFLNSTELNEIQKACFTESELGSQIIEQLRGIADMAPGKDGVCDKGFTWPGFLFIWQRMLENGRYETFWVLLRHCGFNDNFQLTTEMLPLSMASKAQEHVLTDQAIAFLKELFERETSRAINFAKAFPKSAPLPLDKLSSTALSRIHVETLLSFLPRHCSINLSTDSLWNETRYSLPNALDLDLIPEPGSKARSSITIEENTSSLSLDGWLAMWHRLSYMDSTRVSSALPYLGFGSHPLISGVKRPKTTLSAPVRTVAHAFSSAFVVHVVGYENSGRTHLIRGLLNYPFVAELSASQRIWSNATIAISTAASVFKHASTTAPASPKSSSKARPTKPAARNAPIAVKGASSSAAWQAKADVNYQRNMALERGQFIFQKSDMERYLVAGVEDAVAIAVNAGRQADVVLVVYDVANLEAFHRLSAKLREIRQQHAHLPIVLVGTKGDLKDVTRAEATQLAQELAYSSPPIIVSAKRGEYGKLISTMQQTMIAARSTRWTSSAITRLGLRAFNLLIKPRWGILLGVLTGIGIASWVTVAHWGLIRTYIHPFMQRYRPTKLLEDVMISSFRALERWSRSDPWLGVPALIKAIIDRRGPDIAAVPGATKRLAPVRA